MTTTRKRISYRLRPGVTVDEFLEASRAADEDIAKIDGYVERRLFTTEEGRWLDEVIWESHSAAVASEEVIARMPGCARCIGLMDHETFAFEHSELEWSAPTRPG